MVNVSILGLSKKLIYEGKRYWTPIDLLLHYELSNPTLEDFNIIEEDKPSCFGDFPEEADTYGNYPPNPLSKYEGQKWIGRKDDDLKVILQTRTKQATLNHFLKAP